MAQMCKLTGKKTQKAHNVSHSNRKTRKWQYPNLQKKTMLNPATGKMESVVLSTKGLKTLAKWKASGRTYDLRDLQ
jgi:large subunit ribosomal protein L28